MFATITNLIYLAPVLIIMRYWKTNKGEQWLVTAFILLFINSFTYHLLMYVEVGPAEIFRRLDVISIYFLLSAFPYYLSHKYDHILIGIIYFIIFGSLKLFGVPLMTEIPIALMGIWIFYIAWHRVAKDYDVTALVLIVFAFIIGLMGKMFDMDFTSVGYDHPHGWWHMISGLSFIMLVIGRQEWLTMHDQT